MTNMLLKFRFAIIFFITALLVVLSLLVSYSLRFEFNIPFKFFHRCLTLFPAVIAIKLPVFWFFGCFRGWWRYVSLPDLIQIFKANVVGTSLFVFYGVVVYRFDGIPRSVLFLDGLLCFVLVGGVRLITRAFREKYFPAFRLGLLKNTNRVLIYGAGHAGQMIAREIQSNYSLNSQVIGFLDDAPHKQKTTLMGIPVLGAQRGLKDLVRDRQVDQIIIAIPSATGHQVAAIVAECRQTKAQFKILPGVSDLIDGRVSVKQVRDVDLEDLLGRAAIDLDKGKISSFINGKVVFISGAGGSIGSEICRQVIKFKPAQLILFDQSETAVFDINRELLAGPMNTEIHAVIGDVCNSVRVQDVFQQFNPQVVFHAAAYKHVPLMESNPCEALVNNVLGTRTLADLSHQSGVGSFVMVSTDKAVRPTSIMGVSKRIAEMYVQALNDHSPTNYITTRFGNVLGSNGSVIPVFREQISNGGPVTVTHPDIIRYFMTIPEAAQLVLQAGSMGTGGEIYLFDMGEPVKIKHLAEELIRLSGFRPYEDIDIVFTGLRPGEKLYEELLLAEEGVTATPHEKICVADASVQPFESIQIKIDHLLENCLKQNNSDLKKELLKIVPEFQLPDKDGTLQ